MGILSQEVSVMARYPGAITDENIRRIFDGAGDFNYRPLQCGGFTLYSYAIDGLTAGGAASEYIFRPITDHLRGGSMQELYDNALQGMVYNSVAKPCKDLDAVALTLVNGFCVILFPGVGAIAFEVKTPDVTITVKPECSDLIETRIIGGVKYILICADENVEVNGVSINIKESEKEFTVV